MAFSYRNRVSGLLPCWLQARLLWTGLESAEVSLSVEIGSWRGFGIEHWVRHPEDGRHHCFGSFVPQVAMVFDDAGIDFHVPVRHVHTANLFDLPEIEFAVSSIQSEDIAKEIMFQIRF